MAERTTHIRIVNPDKSVDTLFLFTEDGELMTRRLSSLVNNAAITIDFVDPAVNVRLAEKLYAWRLRLIQAEDTNRSTEEEIEKIRKKVIEYETLYQKVFGYLPKNYEFAPLSDPL